MKKFNIILIAGLNCGIKTYNYLINQRYVNLVSIYCLAPKSSKNIAGYIDFKKVIKDKNLFYYSKANEIINYLKNYNNLDLIIAIGISEILSKEILAIPRLGVLGAHAARLPDRPGNAPVVWAIIDNLKETEMTIFKMSEKIDDGLIYDSEKISITKSTDATKLRKRMDESFISLLKKNLFNILHDKNKGKIVNGRRNYTKKRGIKDGELNLSLPAEEILRKIRALSEPYPGSHFYAGDGKAVVIKKAEIGKKELQYEGSGNNLKKNILCVVAHPDDEVLGLGGTLIKHVLQGDNVNVVILSVGESAKSSKSDKNIKRVSNAENCNKIIGSNLFKVFNFPDQQLDKVPQLKIVKKIEKAVEELAPDIIYIHHPYDMNSDHQIAAQTTLAAARPISYHKIIPEIRCFETPSSTDQAPYVEPYIFKPNFYVCIENVWRKKLEALSAYDKEIKKFPHPRSVKSIESLALKRGSEVNLKKAEAFYIIRKLWK